MQNRTAKQVMVINPIVENESERKIRMAAYCRVSTDSDDQQNSFLAQVTYYNELIRSQENAELVDIYADEGITGTCISKREDFKRLIRDCALGRIDRVYVKSVTRFARNSLECLDTIRKLKEYGVSVYFENDNIDTKTMNSELILYVKSAFAQSEALEGAKRVSTAYRMKMESGMFITYKAPLGYRLENGRLVVDPEKAKIVKRIFALYLSGVGLNGIAAIMNREAVDGKVHWTSVAVKYILSNEKYIGDSMMQKTYTPLILPLRKRPNRGEVDKYYAEYTQEPIINKEDFYTVQKMLNKRTVRQNSSGVKRILTRLLVCDECGWLYKYKIQNHTEYWVCAHNGMEGYECPGPNISQKSIYSAFVQMYNKLRQFEHEVLDAALVMFRELRKKLLAENSEIRQIDIEIAKLCEQNSRYEKYRGRGIMDEISYREQTDKLRGRLSELRSRRMRLLADNENERMFDELCTLKENLRDYPAALVEFDADLFELIVKQIKVGQDGTLTFILNGGLSLNVKVRINRKCT